MLTIKNWLENNSVYFLAAALFLTGCTPKGPRALLEGEKLIERGRYAEALEELTVATTIMSTNAAAWNYLGLAYHHTGQPTNAEVAYIRALSIDRNLVEAHYNLGCLRLEQNRPDLAKPELIAYTALREHSADGWVQLATAQLRLRELAAAEKSFREALRLDQGNVEALNGLGLLQLQRRNPVEAAQLFAAALKAEPQYAPALLNLAIVNQNYLNNRALALQNYREYLALPVRPPDWESVNATAQLLDRELNPPAPRVAASVPPQAQAPPPVQPVAPPPAKLVPPTPAPVATVVKSPPSSVARVTPVPVKPQPVATTQPAQTATPAATQRVELVKLAQEPSVKTAQDIRSDSKRPARTQSTPAVAAKSAPAKSSKGSFLKQINPLNLFRRSTSADSASAGGAKSVEIADSRFARYKYTRPAKPNPGDRAAAEAVFAQGAKAHGGNRFAEAIQFYQQATQLDPAFFDAFYNLGLAASAEGILSQALTAYETALAIEPDSLEARYNFALALKQANFILDSANELEKILQKYPKDARVHVILGNLYAQQLGEPLKARAHYQKVLELDPANPQASAIGFWLTSH